MLQPPVRPIRWLGDRVSIIDQRELPAREIYIDVTTADEMAQAIKTMAVRGAPLIGIAAAMGVAVESQRWTAVAEDQFRERVNRSIRLLGSTRPTASNLFWSLERMSKALSNQAESGPPACSRALAAEAVKIFEEDLETGRLMGEIGADLIKDGMTLLTHCNAGGLATSGYGTAIAPMYVAKRRGVAFKVLADETRPLLQGARLTAWELARAGIEVTVICDSAAHSLMAGAGIGLVFVGSDRITLSGDFANKIGTYGIALSAKAAGVPFYVVAPVSTVDFALDNGLEIPIEERDPSEVTCVGTQAVVPEGVSALNPAFDVTPHNLVSGIITERGLVGPPFRDNLTRIRP